jgi:hypothetical protein
MNRHDPNWLKKDMEEDMPLPNLLKPIQKGATNNGTAVASEIFQLEDNILFNKNELRKCVASIICPVRSATKKQKDFLEEFLAQADDILEEVHYPPRDTNQIDDTGGMNICWENIYAIQKADIVFIYWDPTSKGSHFDLGAVYSEFMKYKLGKRKPISIVLLNKLDFEYDSIKSFLRVIQGLETATHPKS